MKTIIITGASGLVATQLTIDLLDKTDYRILLVSTHPEAISERYETWGDRILYFSLFDLEKYIDEGKSVDCCINAAFARSSEGTRLVSSIEFTITLINILLKSNLKSFVNISSQSVYGKNQNNSVETTVLNPDYLYAFGKYTTEVITKLMFLKSNVNWTNIRLASVCENARFMNIFVKNALTGVPIHLTAGNQGCSFIDVRDVSSALQTVIMTDNCRFEEAYNLGTGEMFTIRQIAEKVKLIGDECYGTSVLITEEESNKQQHVGMDNKLFTSTFNWNPSYSMDEMIKSLYEMNSNRAGGGFPKAFKIVYHL